MATLKQVVWLVAITTLGTCIGCASKSPTAPTTIVNTSPAADATSAGGIFGGVAAGSQIELEGLIGAIDAPSRTIRVSNTAVSVPPTAQIRHGDSALQFSDLHINDVVEIHASRVGTVVTAVSVDDETEHVAPADDDPADHDANEDHANDGPGNDANDGPGHDAGGDDHHDGGKSGGSSTTSGDSHHS